MCRTLSNLAIFVLLAPTACAFATKGASSDEPLCLNLLPNPSFEDSSLHTSQVCDWQPAPEFPNAAYSWCSTESREGNHSLRISDSCMPDGTPAVGGWAGPALPAIEGFWYVFSGWIKTDTVGGSAHLVLAWFDSEGRWLRNTDNGFVVTGKTEWCRTGCADIPGEDAAACRPYFRFDGGEGSAWCDDVELYVSEDDAVELPVPHGEFEGEPGVWPDLWNVAGGGDGQIVAVGTEEGEAGACVALDSQRGAPGWFGPRMAYDACHTYKLEVSAVVNAQMAEGGEARVGLRHSLRDGVAERALSDPVSAGEAGWQVAEVGAVPPQEATSGQIVLQGSGSGRFFFDRVQLRLSRVEAKPPQVPLAVAIGRLFTATAVSPDRMEGRIRRFASEEQFEELMSGLERYVGEHPKVVSEYPGLSLFIGLCRYECGEYVAAVRSFGRLRGEFSGYDLRNDVVLRYGKRAREAAEEQRRRECIAELDSMVGNGSGASGADAGAVWLEAADGYWEVGAFGKAVESYSRAAAAAVPASGERERAGYRAAAAMVRDGRYEEGRQSLERFLAKEPDSRFRAEATYWLAEALRGAGEPRRAIAVLRGYGLRNFAPLLRAKAERVLGACSMGLAERSDGEAPAGTSSAPDLRGSGVFYLSEDTQTQGDWRGRYGTYAYVLCAANGYDLVGGKGWPLQMQVSTTAPYERVRPFIAEMKSDSAEALWNPVSREPRVFYWDDRGEVYAGPGPDLVVNLAVGKGTWTLSLLCREHAIGVTDATGTVNLLLPRADSDYDRYRRLGVIGPLDLTIHLMRGESLMTLLKGLFVDEWRAPLAAPHSGELGQTGALSGVIEEYGNIREMARTSPREYFGRFRELWPGLVGKLKRVGQDEGGDRGHAVWWMLWQASRQMGRYVAAESAFARWVEAFTAAGAQVDALEAVLERLPEQHYERERLHLLQRLCRDGTSAKRTQNWRRELADTLVSLGKDSEARELFGDMANEADDPDIRGGALFQQAMLMRAHGGQESAREVLQSLVEQLPESKEAQLAETYLTSEEDGQGQ